MEQFKIRVNNEAESKEAQELFFELGYIWNTGLGVKHLDGKFLYARNGIITLGYDSNNFENSENKEITINQLRKMVADKTQQSKDLKHGGELISGADALRALADGKEVEWSDVDFNGWRNIDNDTTLGIFNDNYTFRIKPHTITINIEVPAPFEPKEGERYWWINPNAKMGYAWDSNDLEQTDFNRISMGVYRIEEDVVKVVAALRSILNAKP